MIRRPLSTSFLCRILLPAALGTPLACTQAPVAEQPAPTPAPATTPRDTLHIPSPAAPWSAPLLAAAGVPPVYHDAWSRAENRTRCALLAPAPGSSGSIPGAAPRAATFAGGWAVAYDLPDLRSAFGVAGTGASAWAPNTYNEWPHRLRWADGSEAGYGLEGGTGPSWLAYLKLPGQECLYNVWSRRGQSHLEQLLLSLRRVAPR